MPTANIETLFTPSVLDALFPRDRADRFFESLFGDVSEGAFDIGLHFTGAGTDRLQFEFHLSQRPGKCLACHLTSGLPEVFSRHPVIDIKGIVAGIQRLMDGQVHCNRWQLGQTREISNALHAIPLTIFVENL
jgi:hypothetical protein